MGSAPKITVSILSWRLEERLIKTLVSIPKSTSLPLNLCLQVQGAEDISDEVKKSIVSSAHGFIHKDIFFTEGNNYSAVPRSELMKRSAITPYIFVTDNDMDFTYGSIDALYNFIKKPQNASYGVVNLVHNHMKYHRLLNNGKVIYQPLRGNDKIVDVHLVGAASLMMRCEVATLPDLIDTEYNLGVWDIDMCMNITAHGWKIGTLDSDKFPCFNDHSHRTTEYNASKNNPVLRSEGINRFISKHGFFPEVPNRKMNNLIVNDKVSVVTRAIYRSFGDQISYGVITPTKFQLIQDNFINSLKRQTDKNFTIYAYVGPEDNEVTNAIKGLDWGTLDVNFIYIDNDFSEWIAASEECESWGREIYSGSPEDIVKSVGIPKDPIMARLDSDDFVSPGWIASIRHLALTVPDMRFLINYQIFSQDIDGRLYINNNLHHRNNTSPFLAIVQKDEVTIGIHECLHLHMGKLFHKVINVSPGYCFLSINGHNRMNMIYGGDNALENVSVKTFKHSNFKSSNQSSTQVSKDILKGARKSSWKHRMLAN